jgi:hypothetical protein
MLRFFLDIEMKTEPMDYIMSAENCIDEITQSTLSVIRSGKKKHQLLELVGGMVYLKSATLSSL